MTDNSGRDARYTSAAFAGLRPTRERLEAASAAENTAAPREPGRIARGLFATVPIVLVGSLAVAGLTATGAVDPIDAKPALKPKSATSDLGTSIAAALKQANASGTSSASSVDHADPVVDSQLSIAAAPSTYKVEGGDTVSAIAGRFGLSTASVLALNGLGWKSVIFPGQVLKLTNAVISAPAAMPAPLPATSSSNTRYTITRGDTVSSIARKFGTTAAAILTANGLGVTSTIFAGRTLTVPGAAPAATSSPVAAKPVANTVSAGATYTIGAGDTISAIARKFGISVPALLGANGLTMSSIIYSGRTLNVGPAPVAITPAIAVTPLAPVQDGTTVTPLSDEMASNARTIVRVGQQLGVPDFGIVVALAAAMQESSLRNIDYGDRDSIGLFQQRPSTKWGSKAQLLDPTHAAKLFYGGPSNPNKGVTLGLLEIPNWQSLTVTQAAQRVQISAYPDAYAKWETSARAWYQSLK